MAVLVAARRAIHGASSLDTSSSARSTADDFIATTMNAFLILRHRLERRAKGLRVCRTRNMRTRMPKGRQRIYRWHGLAMQHIHGCVNSCHRNLVPIKD